jgi:hypothetical protein
MHRMGRYGAAAAGMPGMAETGRMPGMDHP